LGIVVFGFNFTALPLLLSQAGVPVDRIASISWIINLPGVFGFLLAPVVDIKFRRRTWLAISTFGTAVAVSIYFRALAVSNLTLLTVLIPVGGMLTFFDKCRVWRANRKSAVRIGAVQGNRVDHGGAVGWRRTRRSAYPLAGGAIAYFFGWRLPRRCSCTAGTSLIHHP
jgi:hypothetical protein